MPGGSLTYSVCSPLAAEGVERVAAFLRRWGDAFECPPIDEAQWRPFVADAASLGGERRCVQTWSHVHDGFDNFFAARLVRRGAAEE